MIPDVGSKVRVHFNLHLGGYSVIPLPGTRVAANVPSITLRDVEFRVQTGALATIRQKGKRAVYAYCVGVIDLPADMAGMRKVTINPHRTDSFVYADNGEPVWSAARVVFRDGYAWV